MFKIGDFSKLSRVPVKTLRYYDEIGLLKPSGIDRFTRYRYYSVDQLPILYRILGLKELGFSLEQIAHMLDSDLSPYHLSRMLQVRRTEIEHEIQASQEQLAQVDARLRQIEQEGRLPYYEIIVKEVQSQWVAAVSGVIPSYDQSGPILDRLFGEVSAYVFRKGITPSGPGIALYHDTDTVSNPPDEGTTVEAALPLPRTLPEFLPGSERVRIYKLPSIPGAASVVHQGSFTAIGEAYQSLLGWIQANGYRITGPTRELYLRFQRGGDENQHVTEIQIPVHKIRKDKEAMQPKIVSLDKFLVVGMPYLGKNEHGEISQMWGNFHPRIPEIKHMLNGPAYGVCFPNSQGLIDYVAAFPVSKLADIPQGMVGKEIPAQTYVMFESHGIPDIGPTYQRILKEWMPKSGYQPGDGPDFEYYPDTFNPDEPESVLYIYFPIQKA